jgi:hypothetical protein
MGPRRWYGGNRILENERGENPLVDGPGQAEIRLLGTGFENFRSDRQTHGEDKVVVSVVPELVGSEEDPFCSLGDQAQTGLVVVTKGTAWPFPTVHRQPWNGSRGLAHRRGDLQQPFPESLFFKSRLSPSGDPSSH